MRRFGISVIALLAIAIMAAWPATSRGTETEAGIGTTSRPTRMTCSPT